MTRRTYTGQDLGRRCAECGLPMVRAAGVTATTHPSCDLVLLDQRPAAPACTSTDDVQLQLDVMPMTYSGRAG